MSSGSFTWRRAFTVLFVVALLAIPAAIAPGPTLVPGTTTLQDTGIAADGANLTNTYSYNTTIGGTLWIGNATDAKIYWDSAGKIRTNASLTIDGAVDAASVKVGGTEIVSTGRVSRITSFDPAASTAHTFSHSATEDARITSDGRIGVREASPEKRVHISSTGADHLLLEDTDQADGTAPYWAIESASGALQVRSATRSAGSIATATTHLTIDGTGLGIGTSAPSTFVHAKADQDSALISRVENTAGGTSAQTYVHTKNNVGLGLAAGVTSSAFTASGYRTQGGAFLAADAAGGLTIASTDGTAGAIRFATGGSTTRWTMRADGEWYGPAGSTTMGVGFNRMPGAAGAPTGTPDAITGTFAFYYDSTNNKICVYNGAWRCTAALT